MKANSEKHCSGEIVLIYHSCRNKKEAMTHPEVDLSAIGLENRRMTHPEVDLSAIGLENRRMTHAGIPAGPVRSDRVRPVPVLVRKKLYWLQLCSKNGKIYFHSKSNQRRIFHGIMFI
jgi:hypothetical protein